MKKIIYGRWGNVLKEHPDEVEKPDILPHEDFPSPKDFPEDIIALMSGKGFLQFEPDFNFVPMIREYVSQIQAKYCCGKCITGIKGSKMILLTLDRMARGEGVDSDIDLLARMADILSDAAKCSVCQSAGELLKDGLSHFRDHFVQAVRSGITKDSVRYLGRISAPCMNACPCHINIPAYVEALLELRYNQSLKIIREEMPLPGVTGRVCPAPCEKACSVANMGDVPIPIKTLKRVAADYEFIHHLPVPLEKVELTGASVAVIGAGPAGISAAYYLNRLGHPVTVFEALSLPGGMVGVGIPPYRQPRDVLTREVEIIRNLGVTIKYRERLGTDFKIQDLLDQGFKAVFLGVGSHESLPMGIKGENDKIEGVFSGGIDFLRDINLGLDVSIGEKVVVVGGGNTAIDCARTAIRMGASEVSIVYRRSENEMPANADEVEETREEGINFFFLTQPIEILSRDGKMTGLRCLRMELGEPDASGRRRPIPIEGSEFEIEADNIIPAIGQKSVLDFVSPNLDIEVTRRGTIKVDPKTMMTSLPGVFAAGDAVSGPLTVVHGLAGGKRAAKMIHEYLSTGKCRISAEHRMEDLIAGIEKDYGVLVTARHPAREGGPHPDRKVDVQDRIASFVEVSSGFTQRSSYIEASRCLRCFHLILAAVHETDRPAA